MDPRLNLLLNEHATTLPSKYVFVLTNYHSSQSTAENYICSVNHSQDRRLATHQNARVSAVCSVINRTPISYLHPKKNM